METDTKPINACISCEEEKNIDDFIKNRNICKNL